MVVDIFTLCDSAKDYNGKLVIVGTFDTISAKEFPFNYQGLAIVARIVMENHEKGKHPIEISIKKDKENTFLMEPMRAEIDNSNLITKRGTLNLIFNMNNLTIPTEGEYIVILKIGDYITESILQVVQMK